MSCRWPPLTYSRDTDRYREQIFKERSHGRPERPLTAIVASAVPRPYSVPNPMYSWKPLAAESRGFGQTRASYDPVSYESSMRTSTPYPQFRATPRGSGQVHPSSESLMRTSTPLAQFRTKPFNVDHTMLPQRTPEHFSACSEMAQMSWYEPPLVLSRNYCEPRNFFNKCAERSTRSVVNPAVPVVPWKVHGRSPLAPHLTQSGERDAASPGLLMNIVFAHNGMSRACGCAQAKFT
jgi:hypothetical protein